MTDETISNEGLSLKDTLKAKRDSSNISNQEIADRSGLSVHTVANYFASRSKASSAFTVGKICMALCVSFDKAFGIVPDDTPEELNENLAKIADLENRCRALEQEVSHKEEIIQIKEDAIRHAAKELERRRPLIYCLIGLCALLAVLFAAYIVVYDLPNTGYGWFRGV